MHICTVTKYTLLQNIRCYKIYTVYIQNIYDINTKFTLLTYKIYTAYIQNIQCCIQNVNHKLFLWFKHYSLDLRLDTQPLATAQR